MGNQSVRQTRDLRDTLNYNLYKEWSSKIEDITCPESNIDHGEQVNDLINIIKATDFDEVTEENDEIDQCYFEYKGYKSIFYTLSNVSIVGIWTNSNHKLGRCCVVKGSNTDHLKRFWVLFNEKHGPTQLPSFNEIINTLISGNHTELFDNITKVIENTNADELVIGEPNILYDAAKSFVDAIEVGRKTKSA